MAPDDSTTTTDESWLAYERDGRVREVLSLTIVWSLAKPERVGEVALLPMDGTPRLLGRGSGRDADAMDRVGFFRQRPSSLEPRPPLRGQGISRRQLELQPAEGGVRARRLGRCPMLVDGVVADEATVRPGSTIMLRNQLVLLCGRRPLMMAAADGERAMLDAVPFGGADGYGIVGESPAIWELRGQLPFVAKRTGHVLVRGPSGAGKELVSRAIHGLSPRGRRPLVARNAATFPAGLIDAELFGNIKDYPNAGMRERGGLIGESDGSTLFLDEIGELPAEMQAHLLRVLDADGSYQRLGEDRPRRADLRLIAMASSTATSSPRTWSSPATVGPGCSTSAWPATRGRRRRSASAAETAPGGDLRDEAGPPRTWRRSGGAPARASRRPTSDPSASCSTSC